MSNPSMLDQDRATGPDSQTNNPPDESFGDILSQYEQSHTHRTETDEGRTALEGTVVAVTGDDVVVDRRAVLEDEERAAKEKRYSQVKEGETVQGTIRSLTDYGAFVDIGGVDALLHVADISWARVNKPADVLKVGDQVEARVL